MNAAWRAFAFLVILFAVYIAIGRQLLPLVENYRFELAGFLSERLGTSVRIGELRGEWHGFVPSVVVSDVDAGPDFHVGEVIIELSPFSSLASTSLMTSYIAIKDVEMEIVEQESGWQLLGLDFKSNPDRSLKVREFIKPILDQNQVTIEDVAVRVNFLDVPDITVNVEQGLINSYLSHRDLELQANIQTQDEKVELTALADLERQFDQSLSGRIYLSQSEFDWAPWAELVDLPFAVNRLKSNSEFWIELKSNQLAALQSRIHLPEISFEQKDILMELTEVSSDLTLERRGNNTQAWVRNLTFKLDDQLWQPSLHQLHWNGSSLELLSDRLDIGVISNVAELFAPSLQLDTLSPTGLLLNSRVNWNNNPERKVPDIIIQGRFNDLLTEPWMGAPGIAGVEGYIDVSPERGLLTVLPSQATMTFPEVFSQNIDFIDLQGQAQWQFSQEHGLFLNIDRMTARHSGAKSIVTSLNLTVPREATRDYREGRLDIQIGTEDLEYDALHAVLPDGVDPHVMEWVGSSVFGGRLDQGAVHISTATNRYSETSTTTLFKFDLEQVDLKFLPDWPSVQNMDGTLLYDNQGLRAEVNQGEFYHLAFNDAVVEISSEDWNLINLKGAGNGDAGRVLDLLRNTPLRELVEDNMDTWYARGSVAGSLKASIPFDDREVSAVVEADLSGADLIMEDLELAVFNIHGDLNYNDDQGLFSTGLTGEFFGHDTQFAISSLERVGENPGEHIYLSAEGKMNTKSLGIWLDDPLIYELEGTTNYQAKVDIFETGSIIEVKSDLTGIEFTFPEPLTKAKNEAWPLQMVVEFAGEEDALIKAVLDNKYAAEFEMSGSLITRGVVNSGVETRLHNELGIFMNFDLASTDADYWWEELDRLTLLYDSWDFRELDESVPDFDELIKEVTLNVDQLVYLDMPWTEVTLSANRDQDAWTASFKANEAQGVLGFGHRPEDPIILDLEFVSLITEEEDEVDPGEIIDPLQDVLPTEAPPMIVQIKRLDLDGEDWGGWKLLVDPVEGGVNIDNIEGVINGLNIAAKVQWRYDQSGHKTAAQAEIRMADVGNVSENWGYAKTFTSQSGKVGFSLNWSASPLGWELPYLNGDINLEFNNGTILEAERIQGLKYFGLFNFTRIFKRLALDFSDIFGEGFTYDIIKGDLEMQAGVLAVDKEMYVESAVTKVEFDGSYDSVEELVDVDVLVTAQLGATLPLATLLGAFSPQIALALFVTDQVMDNKLQKVFSIKYKVEGPVDNLTYEPYRPEEPDFDAPINIPGGIPQ